MNNIYIHAESTPGAASSSTGVWYELPYAGESMDVSPNYSEGNNVGGTSRLPAAMTLESLQVQGSVNGDFAVVPAIANLIRSIMSNTFTANAAGKPPSASAKYMDLKLGSTKHTLSYLKKIEHDPVGAIDTYHLYSGCMVSELVITSGESGALSYTATIVGEKRVVSTTVPPGKFISAGAYKVLTADKVIQLDLGTLVMATECYKGFTITISSNAIGNICIGTAGNKTIDLGDVTATVEAILKWKNDQFTSRFDHATPLSIYISAKAKDNTFWDFDASNAIVTLAPVNLPGKGEPFLITGTMTILDDSTVDADMLKMGVDNP